MDRELEGGIVYLVLSWVEESILIKKRPGNTKGDDIPPI